MRSAIFGLKCQKLRVESVESILQKSQNMGLSFLKHLLTSGVESLRSGSLSIDPDFLHFCTVEGLRDGLGVEDIAVEHDLDVADVRAKVAEMRADGRLQNLYAMWQTEWGKTAQQLFGGG